MNNFKSLFLLTAILFFSGITYAALKCECGDHGSGITAYNVQGNSCCDGIPGDRAYIHYYALSGGAWEHTHSDEITGTQAMDRCCPNV